MSDTSPAEIQLQVNWNTYVELVSFTILYYDYLVTFDMEVERFWLRSGWSLSAVLFYLNRYLSLFGNVPNLLFSFWTEPFRGSDGCKYVKTFHQFLIAIVQLVVSLLLILRVYVLYGKSRLILVILGLIAVGMVANGFAQWSFVSSSGSPNPAQSVDVGCLQNFSSAQGIRIIALWLGVTVLDVTVFALILHKTIALRRDCPSGLWSVITRDGVMYFGIITVVNVLNVVVLAVEKEYMKSLLPIFSNVVASVMMSHLMLNLRDRSIDRSPGWYQSASTLHDRDPMVFAANANVRRRYDTTVTAMSLEQNHPK